MRIKPTTVIFTVKHRAPALPRSLIAFFAALSSDKQITRVSIRFSLPLPCHEEGDDKLKKENISTHFTDKHRVSDSIFHILRFISLLHSEIQSHISTIQTEGLYITNIPLSVRSVMSQLRRKACNAFK